MAAQRRGAAMAEKVAAQMAENVAAQRRLGQQFSEGNGDGFAVMGVAVVAAAVAVVHHPPLFACGCSSTAPSSLVRTPPPPVRGNHQIAASGPLFVFVTDVRMYFPILHIFKVGTPYTQTDRHRQTDADRQTPTDKHRQTTV